MPVTQAEKSVTLFVVQSGDPMKRPISSAFPAFGAILAVGVVCSACGPKIDGTWELVDTTWTALHVESNGVERSLAVTLDLSRDGDDISGTVSMSTTETIDGETTTESDEGEIVGNVESDGGFELSASDFFDLDCDVDGDRMVCDDSDLDDWEFARIDK